jgi:hypothetical protein
MRSTQTESAWGHASTLRFAVVVFCFFSAANCVRSDEARLSEHNCPETVVAQQASPSEARKAVLVQMKCKLEGMGDTRVDVLPNDGDKTRGLLFGVFNTLTRSHSSPGDIEMNWVSDSELYVRYPTGTSFTCEGQLSDLIVHCAERGSGDAVPHGRR